jgi:lipid A 3-O-deacylase
MRPIAILLVLLCAAGFAGAQSLPSTSLTKGTWDIGVSGTGGFAVAGGVDDVQIFSAGVRVGRVLTGEHGSGFVRGNLEYAFDFHPVNVYFTPIETTYGASFAPLNLKWSFTRGQRVAPYVQLSGGALFTNHDLPFPGTSQVNFQSGVGVGFHYFHREKRAWTGELKYQHISSAGLGDLNPGINTIQFTLGYNWFR